MKKENKIQTFDRRVQRDARGWFMKAIDGNEPGNPFPCEVYFTSAMPGESRGGHYHPAASEWFTLLHGEAMLTLRDMASGETSEVKLTGKSPQTVFVPAGVAHLFFNCGTEDFLLAAYTDRQYHPDDTVPFTF